MEELRPHVKVDEGHNWNVGEKQLPWNCNGPQFKTRLCRYFKAGRCDRGAACNFAHGSLLSHTTETEIAPPTKKTKIVSYSKWHRELKSKKLKQQKQTLRHQTPTKSTSKASTIDSEFHYSSTTSCRLVRSEVRPPLD